MDADVLRRFRCPRCRLPVEEHAAGVVCERDHLTPRRDGFLDAMVGATDPETARTLDSFGYEWTTFHRVNDEDEAFWKVYFQDVPLEELAGVVGLDAGCGKGRFTRLTAPHVKALVALDGSSAVEAAVANLSHLDNVEVVRADLRHAPFEDGSFGFVCSLGVLHHLPDPEGGLHELVRLLAPGGLLLLYLYSRPEGFGVRRAGLAAAAAMRGASRHLPRPLLRALSALVAAGLYAGMVLPGAVGARRGVTVLARLPLQAYRNKPLRSLWLDTFDRLSAPLERRYVWSELEPWFRGARLEVVAAKEDAGFFIVCRRPPEAAGRAPIWPAPKVPQRANGAESE